MKRCIVLTDGVGMGEVGSLVGREMPVFSMKGNLNKLANYGIMQDIFNFNPDVTLAVGIEAVASLTNWSGGSITDVHGAFLNTDKLGVVIPTLATVNDLTASYRENDVKKFLAFDGNIPPVKSRNGSLTGISTGYVYLDIETRDLDWEFPVINSVQVLFEREDTVRYFDKPTLQHLNEMFRAFKNNDVTLVVHNSAFDLVILTRYTGMDWFSLNYVDTLLLARARGLVDCGLKHLASLYSSVHPYSYIGSNKDTNNRNYACADVLATRDVHMRLIQKGYRPIDYLSRDANSVFSKAKMRGVPIDIEFLREQLTHYEARNQELIRKLSEYAEINWKSAKQVYKALKSLGVPLSTYSSSVAEEVLDKLREHDVVSVLLEFRGVEQMINTFLLPYTKLGTSTIHPTTTILGSDAGRTSARDPNIQQLHKGLKAMVVPSTPEGCIASMDLDTSEVIVLALLCGDAAMIHALNTMDFHRYVASICFQVDYDKVTKEQRQIAKAIVFGGVMYGGTPMGIAKKTGVAEAIIATAVSNLQQGFPGMTRYFKQQLDYAKKYNRTIDVFGKIRDLRQIKQQSAQGRVAKNTPIQAVSAYICLLLSVSIDLSLEPFKSRVLFQVHDEIVIDVAPGEEPIVQQAVDTAFLSLENVEELTNLPGWGKIKPKGTVSFGPNWLAAKG